MTMVDPSLTSLQATTGKGRAHHARKASESGAAASQPAGDTVELNPLSVTTGNKVTAALGGDAATAAVEKALASAKTSVQVEVYRLGNDKLLSLLASQARQGVKVQVLLDPTPGYNPVDAAEQTRMRQGLEAAGVQILRYPIEQKGKIDHVKLLVVDGKTALIGGLNWDQHSHYNLDADVEVQGPAVNGLQGLFEHDWNFAGGTTQPGIPQAPADAPAVGDAKVTLLTTDKDRQDIRTAVLHDISGAKKNIRMFAFALTDKDVIQGLIDAKKRGVDVRVMMDPNKPMSYVNHKAERTLKEAGIDVRYLKVDLASEQKLHAKAAAFDDDTVIVGSCNFTNNGFAINHEADVEVVSKEVGPAFTKFYDDLWDNRSLKELPDLPNFEETASPESYGDQVAHNLFDWYNSTYHPGVRRLFVGEKKKEILDAMERYSRSGATAPDSADELDRIGSLAAFLAKRQVWDINPGPGTYARLNDARVKIAADGEKTVPAHVAQYKQQMVDLIQDPRLKDLLKNILDHAPDGFYKSPSSSTGHYHPADETRLVDVEPHIDAPTDAQENAYPGGGLVLHSRRNVELAKNLCDFWGITGKQRDEVLMGEALHDICKFVSLKDFESWKPGQPFPWGKWTTPEHAHVGAEFVKRMDPSGGALTENVRRYIDMHMGAWNAPKPTPPTDHAEMIISLADYLASQPEFYVKV